MFNTHPKRTAMHWLKNVAVLAEPVLEAMREVGTKADYHMRQYWKLVPNYGERSLGIAWWDEWIHAEVLNEYLTFIRRGRSPSEASEFVKKLAREWVKKHNTHPGHGMAVCVNGQWENERADMMADSWIEWAERLLLVAYAQPEPEPC